METRWHGEAPELFASSQETRVGFCQLCVAAKQSLNVSKGSVKTSPKAKDWVTTKGHRSAEVRLLKQGWSPEVKAGLQDGIEGRQSIFLETVRELCPKPGVRIVRLSRHCSHLLSVHNCPTGRQGHPWTGARPSYSLPRIPSISNMHHPSKD